MNILKFCTLNFFVPEFGEFSQGQEECRRKWLDLEKQIQVMKHKISEANKHQSKLELSNHHVEMLLKEEVKMRRSLQEDISQYVISSIN